MLPLSALPRALTPLALAGLTFMALSGPILFAADATALARSSTFGWKLALIVIALVNALAFRRFWRGTAGEPSVPLRLMAIVFIALWLSVAALGRLIAYT